MTRTFVSVRRIAALSVCFALFSASVALAQTPGPPTMNPASNPRLLSNSAFARLVRQEPTVAAAPLNVNNVSRIDLRGAVTVPAARRTPALFAAAPQQRSWAAQHKVLTGIIIGAAAFFTAVTVCLFACPE